MGYLRSSYALMDYTHNGHKFRFFTQAECVIYDRSSTRPIGGGHYIAQENFQVPGYHVFFQTNPRDPGETFDPGTMGVTGKQFATYGGE